MKNLFFDEDHHLSELSPYYETMLIEIIDFILMNAKEDPSYPFIDTKINIISGDRFEPMEDESKDFKSRCSVFGWIQGRGLESLVGHAKWLKTVSVLNESEKSKRIEKLNVLIKKLFDVLEKIRLKNNGHLFFTFNEKGDFFKIDETGNKVYFKKEDDYATMSDLFYVKGLVAAVDYLGLTQKSEEVKIYFRKIIHDIDHDLFKGDQVSFDPKNIVKGVPGVKGQGVRMICLGALALFYEIFQEQEWSDKGCEYIQYIMKNFCNYDQKWSGYEAYDFIERVNASDFLPYVDDRGALSDPGHSLEMIGLAMRLLLQINEKKDKTELEEQTLLLAKTHFTELFLHCFDYGFNDEVGGIMKAFDVKGRKPINDDMPWWNLPETMRAGAEMIKFIADDKEKLAIKEVIIQCSNSFVNNYVNPDVFMMAYQTIDNKGMPVDTIPATPDADPGYHTGLSIIDYLNIVRELKL